MSGMETERIWHSIKELSKDRPQLWRMLQQMQRLYDAQFLKELNKEKPKFVPTKKPPTVPQAEYDELKKQYDEALEKLKEIDELKDQLAKANKEIAKLKKQLVGDAPPECDKCAELRDQLALARGECAKAEEEARMNARLRQNLEKDLGDVKKELTTLASESMRKIEDLGQALASAQEELKKAKEQLEKEREQWQAKLKAEQQARQKSEQAIKAQMAAMEQKVKDLDAKIQQLDEENANLKSERASLIAEKEALMSDNQSLRAASSRPVSPEPTNNKELDDLRRSSALEKAQFEKQIKGLKDELDALRRQLAAANEKADAAEARARAAAAGAKTPPPKQEPVEKGVKIKRDPKDIQRIKELEDENSQLKIALEEMRCRLEKLMALAEADGDGEKVGSLLQRAGLSDAMGQRPLRNVFLRLYEDALRRHALYREMQAKRGHVGTPVDIYQLPSSTHFLQGFPESAYPAPSTLHVRGTGHDGKKPPGVSHASWKAYNAAEERLGDLVDEVTTQRPSTGMSVTGTPLTPLGQSDRILLPPMTGPGSRPGSMGKTASAPGL